MLIYVNICYMLIIIEIVDQMFDIHINRGFAEICCFTSFCFDLHLKLKHICFPTSSAEHNSLSALQLMLCREELLFTSMLT